MNKHIIYGMIEDTRDKLNVLIDNNKVPNGLTEEMLFIMNSMLIISDALLAELRVFEFNGR